MGLLQSWEPGNKLPYSTVLGAGSNMLDALLRACQVGEEQPGAFLPQSIPSRAGRRRMQLVPWQDRWADKGCSAAAPRQGSHPGPTHTHTLKAALRAPGDVLPVGCTLTWLERAWSHVRTSH